MTTGGKGRRASAVAQALGRMDVRAAPSPAERRVAGALVDPGAPAEPIKHLTLYLNRGAWAQLQGLAVRLDVRPHSLLVRAVNALFEAEGLPPLARDRQRTKG